jgi:hypothetical protein
MNLPGSSGLEHAQSHVRGHAICQLVNEVLYDERVAVAAVDLEYALHNVAPAEQQLAFVLGQVERLATNRSTTVLPLRDSCCSRKWSSAAINSASSPTNRFGK